MNPKPEPEPLDKIPTPPRLVWREIRHRFFPGIIFAIALGYTLILWRQQVGVPHLVGEVESVTGLVTTVEDGSLLELKVDRYQFVQKGEAIGEFRVSDPDAIRLELATLAAELQVTRTRIAQDQQRILQDFEQLRLNWLQERVALATARVELRFAESELARVGRLAADKLISDDQFDLAKSVADSRRAEVAEREHLVEQIEASMNRLTPEDAGRFGTAVNDQISQAIAAQEQLLKEGSKTLTLRAPIAGLVTAIHHRQGERIRRGETIATVVATTPERIVAYLRESPERPPQTGDDVEVRSRTNRRQVGIGKVLRVGMHFEAVSTNIAAAHPGFAQRGLPILVSLPENMALLPGELVDLALRSQ